jgi:hypothetical protein
MAHSVCCGHRPVCCDGCVRSAKSLRWFTVCCPFVGLLLLLTRLLGNGGLQALIICAVVGSEHSLAMGLNMKRDERLRRAQLANLLLDAIEKAEQLGEPDIAEIVREFRAKWKAPV